MSRQLLACALVVPLLACNHRPTGGGDGGTDEAPFTGSGCSSTVSAASGKCVLPQTATLPAPRTATTALRMGDDLVLVGGQAPGGELSGTIFVNHVSGGALGEWKTSAIPEPRPNAGIAASGEHLYVFGGELPGTLNAAADALMSQRNPDGTFGEFRVMPALPGARTQMGAAATATHVYLVGGRTNVTANDDPTVTIASLGADGTVTGYAAGTPLPHGRGRPSVVVVKDRLYVIGGLFTGNDRSCSKETVLFAPINPDGSLGAWTGTTSLPRLPAGAAVAATEDRIYVVGGVANYGDTYQQIPVASVLVADVKEDGSLGTWERVASFKDTRYGHSALVMDGRLLVFGGLVEGVRVLDEILTATVKGDGRLSCD